MDFFRKIIEGIKRFLVFVRESWHEVTHQVTYPSWAEVQGTSTVVIITSILFAVSFYLVDLAMGEAVRWFFARFA